MVSKWIVGGDRRVVCSQMGRRIGGVKLNIKIYKSRKFAYATSVKEGLISQEGFDVI
jgi:hypothetical protein